MLDIGTIKPCLGLQVNSTRPHHEPSIPPYGNALSWIRKYTLDIIIMLKNIGRESYGVSFLKLVLFVHRSDHVERSGQANFYYNTLKT